MAGRQRTSFDKMQRERARQEEQARKRARRRGVHPDGTPIEREEGPPADEQAAAPMDPPTNPATNEGHS